MDKVATRYADGFSLQNIHEQTDAYRINITFSGFDKPDLALIKLLQDRALKTRAQFLDALPKSRDFPELKDRQLRLQLNIDQEAVTHRFISIHEKGYFDMGGAHAIPIESAWVFDVLQQAPVTLNALFVEPNAAQQALAEQVRSDLLPRLLLSAPDAQEELSADLLKEWQRVTLKMLDEGTAPNTDNYDNFVVLSGHTAMSPSPGLRFVFPPYQVAAYVYGTQTVDVPAAVFRQWLKPEYLPDFVPAD